MHSVFRIGFVEKIENSDRLWQVNLTLSKSNDPELLILMKSIESDIDGPTGWFQLGNLMMRVAQFDKAEQIYNIVLNQETDEITKGYIYHQRTLQESITYYEKALEIREKTLPASHSELATTYNNLGMLYCRLGEYSTAVTYFANALDILQNSLSPNHPFLEQVKENYETTKKKDEFSSL